MKPDKAKLLSKIEGMKSICSDGRREVRELIEELIGEKLSTKQQARIGQIWKDDDAGSLYLVANAGDDWAGFVNIKSGNRWSNFGRGLANVSTDKLTYLADSLDMYIAQGGKL